MMPNDLTQPRARTLRWWTETQLSGLGARLAHARSRWQRAWIDDCPAVSDDMAVRCFLAHDNEGGASSPLNAKAAFEFQSDFQSDSGRASTSKEASRLWVASHEGFDDALTAVLLDMSVAEPVSRKSKIVSDLVAAAFEDCLNEIKIALTPAAHLAEDGLYRTVLNADIPGTHRQPWSGAICVSFPLYRDLRLHLHIAPDLAALLLNDGTEGLPTKRKAPVSAVLAPLQDALHDQPIGFRAELSPVELSLGHLQSLSIGDVLLLQHPLTQALEVKDQQGVSLCAAYLGQSGGNRAIELVPSSSAKTALSL